MDKRSERLAQLEKAVQSIERGLQTPQPKIQRVDKHLRENQNFAKYYSPRLLSIGPIHHGKENLKLGEHYKLIWTAMYLKESKQNPHDLCQKIEQHIEEVKGLYTEDAIGDYNDNDLMWMFFIDGCSVLQIMHKLDAMHPEELWIKFDQQEHVVTDLFLLENQIPYKVLELLNNLVSGMLNLRFHGLLKNNVLHHVVPQSCDDKSWAKILEGLSLEARKMKTKPNHVLAFLHFIMFDADHVIIQNKRKQEIQIQISGDHEDKREGVPHLVLEQPQQQHIRATRY